MDPNVTLRNLLQDVAETLGNPSGDTDRILSICEGVEALNTWLSSGGFLPTAWDGPQRREK